MESMKRIDVLKGIEKILIEKAYETGHISHRADGDWQKQADGSWKPYTGQSAQPTSQAQEPAPTEDTEYGEITEEDLVETPNDTIYSTEDITATTIDGEDAYEIAGTPVVAVKDPTGKWQVMGGDKIIADGLNTALAHETMVKTMNDKYGFDSDEEDSNDFEAEDVDGYYGNSGGLRDSIYQGAYDTRISMIGNTDEDEFGNSTPNDEAIEDIVRGIMQEWTGDTDDKDAVEAVHDGLKDAIIDRWASIYNYDEYDEEEQEDLIETPKFDSDNEEKNFLKEEYGIDPVTYKDSDVQAIRHDLSTTYGLSGDELEYVADLVVNNLPEDDEPSDDEIYDYEDELANEEDKFNQYKISHPRPALSNDGHSKGLTSEKDMFEDSVERFRELTDPYSDERLTALEALKQMNEEMSYGRSIDPETYTPAIESGYKKFSDWISDFAGVEKSAVRDMRSTPRVKNMGF